MPGDAATSPAPATAPVPVPVPEDHACAACGYPMGTVGGRTCPECGRVATDEDVREATRRRVYLEATLVPTTAFTVAVPFASVLLLGAAPFTAAYAILASIHVSIQSAMMGRLGGRAIADRVMLSASVRSGWVLHAPLLAGIGALEYFEHRRWWVILGYSRGYAFTLPDAIGLGAPLFVLLGIALHRLAARRAHRIAGVQHWARERATPRAVRGWIYPPLAVSGLIAVGYVLLNLTR